MTLRSNVRFAAIFFAALVASPNAMASTFDLTTDWSNSANPNGPWSYREGNTVLPFVSNWVFAGQPAWAPSGVSGNFIPGWFKAVPGDTAASFCGGCDWQVGDVVVHTNDAFNGNPALGNANVLFTAPISGTADISGLIWNARNWVGLGTPRPQQWDLLVNGALAASGSLPGDGSITEASPTTFNLSNIMLHANDTVDLTIFETGAAGDGDFVGTDLRVDIVPTAGVPELSTWVMLLFGFAGLGMTYLRKSNAALMAT